MSCDACVVPVLPRSFRNRGKWGCSRREWRGGGVRGCLVFNYKEWVIQKGVVESEKTERKKKGYGKNESSPKFVNVIPSENNPSLRRASNFYYRP